MTRSKDYKLVFSRKDGFLYIGLLSIGQSIAVNDRSSSAYLTEKENRQLFAYSGRRRNEFLCSRLLVKNVVIRSIWPTTHNKIEITNGVLGQPILNIFACPFKPGLSISHKDGLVGCLIFDEAHPVGLDIELLSEKANNISARTLTCNEERIARGNCFGGVIIWSAKEALSKILQCGMAVPLHFFEVAELREKETGYTGKFQFFHQYRFISFKEHEYIVTIVFPGNSKLDIVSLRSIDSVRFLS